MTPAFSRSAKSKGSRAVGPLPISFSRGTRCGLKSTCKLRNARGSRSARNCLPWEQWLALRRPRRLTRMSWLQDMPIRWKVTLVILLTSTASLLLACGAFIHHELIASRQAMVRDLEVLADVLGQNSTAALKFDDQSAAENILLALRAKPHLVAACLFTKQGQRFAAYASRGTRPELPSQPEEEGHRFTPDRLALFRPVRLDQKVV